MAHGRSSSTVSSLLGVIIALAHSQRFESSSEFLWDSFSSGAHSF